MEPQLILKLQAAYGTEAKKILRKYEKKMNRKASKEARDGKNFPAWGIRASQVAQQKDRQRKLNRYTHLARAFLKGTPYKVVEQSVREHNQPDPSLIHEVIYSVGVGVNQSFVKEWTNS